MTLAIIPSNHRLIREERYPRTWLLYKTKDTIEIHVRHDSHNRPFVLDKVSRGLKCKCCGAWETGINFRDLVAIR